MPAQQTGADPIAYPCLKRSDIDKLIGVLVDARRAVSADDPPPELDGLMAYLINFHTRRWGLPTSLQQIRDAL